MTVECLFCGVAIRERPLKRGSTWCRTPGTADASRVLCEPSPNGLHRPDAGPEDGHTFRVSVTSRGSYGIAGEEGHTDADEFMGPAMTLDVRAWNLPEALRRAAARPLSQWSGFGEPPSRETAKAVIAGYTPEELAEAGIV